jgi:hypothetical protein
MASRYSICFGVKLSPKLHGKLQALAQAQEEGTTLSEVVRHLIADAPEPTAP